MRILTSILGLLMCGPLAAADTWRWVDKDGGVHYSDQQTPGAERVPLINAPAPGSVAPSAAPPRAPAAPATPFAYVGCEFVSPNADQVFINVNAVSASINVLPALQPGHRIIVQVNGRRVAEWPEGSSGYLLQNLFRGSYSLMATVTDAAGATLCTSNAVSFHIRQPSILTPGARAAPRS